MLLISLKKFLSPLLKIFTTNGWFCGCYCLVLKESCLTLCDPMDPREACQAPLSMGFPRQEYWSGLPFPPPGHLPHPGTKPASPVAPALAGGFFITAPPGKPLCLCMSFILVERKMWKDSGLPLNLVEHLWYRPLITATLYFSFAGSLVSLGVKFKIFIAFFYSFSFWDLLLPSREKLSFKMCDFIIHNQE